MENLLSKRKPLLRPLPSKNTKRVTGAKPCLRSRPRSPSNPEESPRHRPPKRETFARVGYTVAVSFRRIKRRAMAHDPRLARAPPWRLASWRG